MKEIKRIWKHVHENLPNIEVNQYGQMINSKSKDPPFRYMVSYEDNNGFFIKEVLAVDELDAIVQFNKER